MVKFSAILKRFEQQGEKTGWTYFEIPPDIAGQLKPGTRKSFRVKGKLDKHSIAGVATVPMGGGAFIIAVNAGMRKAIAKKHGAMINVVLEEDKKGYELNRQLMACLADEPGAAAFFDSLSPGHRNYFSKWIDAAKTEPTRVKRIAQAVSALARKWGYPEMIRFHNKKNQI